jgi:hypothetical protein
MLLETTDHILGTLELPDEGALDRERKQFQELYRHFARDLVGKVSKSRQSDQDSTGNLPSPIGESAGSYSMLPSVEGRGTQVRRRHTD